MDSRDTASDFCSGMDATCDLEFFHELFVDLPCSESLLAENGATAGTPSEAPAIVAAVSAATARSDRRRQRWSPSEEKKPAGCSGPVPCCDWRQAAKVQKREREQAEKENARLRKLVDAHARAAQKTSKILRKAVLLSSRDLVLEKPAIQSPYRGPPFDLEQLTVELDKFASEANAVLATSALASAHPAPFAVENRIVHTAAGEAFETTVEVAWVLPFDVELISSTLHVHAIRLVTQKNNRIVETVYDTPQLKVTQAVSRAKEKNGLRVTKHGQLATRREPPRSDGSQLLVIAGQGCFVMGSTVVVSIEGGSYVLVSSVPGHDSAVLGPLSSVRWYRRFRAQPSTEANLTPARRAKWIEAFTLKSARKAERQVDKVTQAMEDLLLATSSTP